MSEPRIFLSATPIGHDGDASARLIDLLGRADLIAAEDTRRLLNLAGRLNVTLRGKVIAFHDHNEQEKSADLIVAARQGQTVLMVSDAGMPGVSDPGYRLARAAIDAGVDFTVVPGPSAPVTALALSGIPTDRFSFEGFAPRKDGERRSVLTEVAQDPRTLIYFDSPHRAADTLAIMAEIFGPDRHAAVCRELTKTYEEAKRGTLSELAQWATGGLKGEITIVVAGADKVAGEVSEHVGDVLELAGLGVRLKDAAAYVSRRTGIRKKDLYEAALDKS